MTRWLDVIVVPDGKGQSKRLRIRMIWLRIGIIIGGATLLAIAIGTISWSGLARQALDYNRLESENARLLLENSRIIRVAREVDQSRQILAQIVRSLGGHLELGRSIDADSSLSISNAYSESQLSESAEGLLDDGDYHMPGISAYEMPTLMPVGGFITQTFFEDFLFPQRSHRGIDIAAKNGVPVKTAASGRVVFSAWTPNMGNCIIVSHRNGYVTMYGHNTVNLKDVNQDVRRGEVLALLGTSGHSSAPHLHFEIWKDGVPVDPLEFVRPDEEEVDGF